MTMLAPAKHSLHQKIEVLLPKALHAVHPTRFNQTVYFLGGAQQCTVLDILSQSEWKQRKVALRPDGTLCVVWGRHTYVNVPNPPKPTKGAVKQLRWFVKNHAFGIALGPFWRRFGVPRLGMIEYSLREIVDPLYAGDTFPLYSHTATSGRSSK